MSTQEDLLTHFFQEVLSDSIAEDLLVQATARAMQAKLRHSREQRGRHGWHTKEVTTLELETELRAKMTEYFSQVSYSDNLIDIVNLAAMIRLRNQIYGGGHEGSTG